MDQREAAIAQLRAAGVSAETGLILGTGLSGMARMMKVEQAFPYPSLPGFVSSTVESHSGSLLFGEIEGRKVLAMQGRFHLYEGYSAQQIVFPVRVMAGLGVNTLLVSNAAGALNPAYRKGELMLLEDHINLQHTNPLIGPNNAALGPRFPDMSAPYDATLRERMKNLAQQEQITLHEGCYVAVTGPMLETRAEYRYLRRIGADAVGMSTVPEIIVARHMGVRCMAVSVLTDECDPDHLQPVTLEEIIRVANEADAKLSHLLCLLIKNL
jgi:purine-nucleoside phosphorylase